MTRLEHLRMSLARSERLGDVNRLRYEIPELYAIPISDREIEGLYHDYSESMWAAGWYGGPDIEGFREWLTEEIAE